MHIRSIPAAAFWPAATLVSWLCTPGFAQTTARASVDSAALQGNLVSRYPSISADGRFVAFDSSATNLATGDTNGNWDVFVRDLPNGMTTRVSVDASGGQVSGDSRAPTLSADGRYVAFYSLSPGLVGGDTNGVSDVFVRDLLTGSNTLVSVDSSGAHANGASTLASISPDGRYVAFLSSASNLVAGDTNNVVDVFVHDLLLGGTTRASVDSAGVQANNACFDPSISRDGRFVAFGSSASNLVPGDTNGVRDVFVRDLSNNTTVRASVDSAATQGNGNCGVPSLSADGRFVGFAGLANNLVPGDTNGALDVFVRDLQGLTTSRVSVSSSGAQSNGNSGDCSISADGRWISFGSSASNLVLGDTNGVDDVFLRDRVAGTTVRVSVSITGGEGDQPNVAPSISADGRVVAFICLSEVLIAGDTNLVRDALVRDLVSGDLENLSLDSAAVQSDGMTSSVALDGSGTRAVFQSYGENLVPNDTNSAPDVFLRLRGPFHPSSCAGDGSLPTACPCGNTGALGHGCANSEVAAGGVLEGEGGTGLDEVTLVAHDLLPHALAIVLQGDSLSSGGLLFGDGVRCVGGALRRLYVLHAQFGTLSAPGPYDLGLRARAQALGDPLPPGSLRGYQVYYRDPSANFCPAPSGSTWNVTNAITVQW